VMNKVGAATRLRTGVRSGRSRLMDRMARCMPPRGALRKGLGDQLHCLGVGGSGVRGKQPFHEQAGHHGPRSP
jgi:hypothetical protein